jgi:hypothetical protein
MERLTNEFRLSPAQLLEIARFEPRCKTANRKIFAAVVRVFGKEMDEPQGSFLDDLRKRRLEFLLALSQLVLKHETDKRQSAKTKIIL